MFLTVQMAVWPLPLGLLGLRLALPLISVQGLAMPEADSVDKRGPLISAHPGPLEQKLGHKRVTCSNSAPSVHV
jgi:hypothetical protein